MIRITFCLSIIIVPLSHSYVPLSLKNNVCPTTCSCNSDEVVCERGMYANGQLAPFINEISPNVKYLTIINSRFPVFPYFNKNFENLISLRVIYSELETFQLGPRNHMPFLTLLSFHNNVIQDLDAKLFLGHFNLRDLDLSKNKIRTLPSRIFVDLYNLRKLSLQYNKLRFLPFYVFNNLTSLQELNLSHNEIKRLSLALFNDLLSLKFLDLSSNHIQTMHKSVLPLINHYLEIHLPENPWECKCGIDWIIDNISNNTNFSYINFSHVNEIKCATPPVLRGKRFNEISLFNLSCVPPQLYDFPINTDVWYWNKIEMKCRASGDPQPSTIWTTPWNEIFVHESIWHLLPPDVLETNSEKTLFLPPYYQNHVIAVDENGTLWISHFRLWFVGEYKCTAWNIAGNQSISAKYNITSPLLSVKMTSLFIGGCASGIMLLIGVIIGNIVCCYNKYRKKHLIYISNCEMYLNTDEKYLGPSCKSQSELELNNVTSSAKDASDNVKTRLKIGMGKHVDRMRDKVQTIKETSNQYVQTIRDTSSHYVQTVRDTSNYYMQTLKESSSQYTQRMLHGVERGVEHVKYHVQSIKELCGTGDLGQTISQVSISTDIDSNKQTEVVKKITYV